MIVYVFLYDINIYMNNTQPLDGEPESLPVGPEPESSPVGPEPESSPVGPSMGSPVGPSMGSPVGPSMGSPVSINNTDKKSSKFMNKLKSFAEKARANPQLQSMINRLNIKDDLKKISEELNLKEKIQTIKQGYKDAKQGYKNIKEEFKQKVNNIDTKQLRKATISGLVHLPSNFAKTAINSIPLTSFGGNKKTKGKKSSRKSRKTRRRRKSKRKQTK
jgi:hypothetical protein